MRLFTGLDLPAEVAGNLERLLERLRPTARIAWSPPANLHITTKFIGEWPEERLGELKDVLAALPPRAPLALHIAKVGFFPNPHSPRVFWCGIEAPGLAELAADHGSIAGAEYDPAADRYEPAKGGPALVVAAEVAARIAATLRYE